MNNLIFISSEDAPTPREHSRRRTLNQVHLLKRLILVKMSLHDKDSIHSRVQLGCFFGVMSSLDFGFLGRIIVLICDSREQVELAIVLEPLPRSFVVTKSKAANDLVLVLVGESECAKSRESVVWLYSLVHSTRLQLLLSYVPLFFHLSYLHFALLLDFVQEKRNSAQILSCKYFQRKKFVFIYTGVGAEPTRLRCVVLLNQPCWSSQERPLHWRRCVRVLAL